MGFIGSMGSEGVGFGVDSFMVLSSNIMPCLFCV
jgi:hypothetical protein